MPRLSCFTPFGMLAFSSRPSEGEKVYRAMRAGMTDPESGQPVFDLSVGTHQEAKLYASAMAIAAAHVTTIRAGEQLRPETSYELLRAHERRFDLRPSTFATVSSRRQALLSAQRAATGGRREVIENGLRAIFGSAFLAYRVVKTTEASVWPTTPGLGPGVFPKAEIPARLVRLTSPVTLAALSPPTERTISYENWIANEPEVLLRKGDVIAVQPENLGVAERVTVTAVAGTGSSRTFTATFTKAHDIGASATTGRMPILRSTKRFAFIVVTAAAAVDRARREAANAFMAKVARAVSQWAIVQGSGGTIGPFTLDSSVLGTAPIGTFTY
jgi:hypothetical protein